MAAHIDTGVPLPGDRFGSPVIASFRVPPNLGDDFATQAIILIQVNANRFAVSRIGYTTDRGWMTIAGRSACTGDDALTNAFVDFQEMLAEHRELPLKW